MFSTVCVWLCVCVSVYLHIVMLGTCFMCFFSVCVSTHVETKMTRLGSFDVINQTDIDWLLLNMIK